MKLGCQFKQQSKSERILKEWKGMQKHQKTTRHKLKEDAFIEARKLF